MAAVRAYVAVACKHLPAEMSVADKENVAEQLRTGSASVVSCLYTAAVRSLFVDMLGFHNALLLHGYRDLYRRAERANDSARRAAIVGNLMLLVFVSVHQGACSLDDQVGKNVQAHDLAAFVNVSMHVCLENGAFAKKFVEALNPAAYAVELSTTTFKGLIASFCSLCADAAIVVNRYFGAPSNELVWKDFSDYWADPRREDAARDNPADRSGARECAVGGCLGGGGLGETDVLRLVALLVGYQYYCICCVRVLRTGRDNIAARTTDFYRDARVAVKSYLDGCGGAYEQLLYYLHVRYFRMRRLVLQDDDQSIAVLEAFYNQGHAGGV
jgi:hypothetical protein